MPRTTNIFGQIYDAQGAVILHGKLSLRLQQDIISVDGVKIIPVTITQDLSEVGGNVSLNVVPTVGASPASVAYHVEFDPDPTDTTRPARNKDGYWVNFWAVPDTTSIQIGNFASALRGVPSANFQPLGATVASLADTVTIGQHGDTDKTLIANQGSTQPKIEYVAADAAWEISNDGSTLEKINQPSTLPNLVTLGPTAGTATKRLRAHMATTFPEIRYNNGTASWEISHDGTVFDIINTPSSLGAISAINAGAGLTGGGNSGIVDIAIDTGGIDDSMISPTAAIQWSKMETATVPSAALPVDNTTIVLDAGNLTAPGSVPPGGIVMWTLASAPTGWLLCDGSAVSRTTYARLFGVIATAYGVGDGSTTFNVPDMRQRFPLGKAASGTGSTLAGTGGAIDHTHTGPAHTHTISSDGAHTHNVNSHTHGISNDGGHSHGGSTGNAGGSFVQDATDFGSGANTVPTGNHFHGLTTDTQGAHSHGGATSASAPSTDSAGAHTHGGATGSDGTGATGTANAPFLSLQFIIKH